MAAMRKPLPKITPENQPFWDAARRGELWQQRCAHCGAYYEPPVIDCRACHHPEPRIEWARVSGRGKVHTFNVYHRAYIAAFAKDVPYNTAIVELDEGPLLKTQITGCRNEEIRIGMPVEVVFEKVSNDVSLPKFRPLS
jgi:uncharacterized OB-fold protein